MTDIQVGDRIRSTAEGVVTHAASDYFILDGSFPVGKESERFPGHKIEKVHHPKAQVGEVITGRQLKQTWWKRGTVIRGVSNGNYLFLDEDGDWTRDDGELFYFEDVLDDHYAEVVYLPDGGR